ncbi:MAG TPA: amidohydrolase family protein [Chloroflexota bacterium]|nr:amidohydrolase family protein [Chloroflexota bacterium]
MALPVTVDFHAHAQSPKAAELIAQAPNNPGGEPNPHNEHLQRTRYHAAFTDLNVRLQTMDRQRIDMQVVSPAPNYAYWADQHFSERIAQASNEHVAELCANKPDRFVGLGHVSLQFPELAAQQVPTILDSLHLKGIEIGTRAENTDLDDSRLEPLWSVAEARQAPIFIHPAGTTLGKRVAKYYLTNVIGNPLDTTIALTSLIFGGVLERFPNLRVVAAHGGGYLPSYFARSVHGYEVRPELRTIPHSPVHYLRRVWVDNLVYQPEYLAHIINVIGPSQVVLGTDYPFDMGQEAPVDLLEAVGGLSTSDLAAIKGENALRLLGMA